MSVAGSSSVAAQSETALHRPAQAKETVELWDEQELAALAPPALKRDPLGDLSSCEEAIAQEAGTGYRQGIRALLEKGPERLWPRSGPAFGGKEVFILPRTHAAQAPSVQCRFGLSTTAAGFDAFYGLILCTPPPQLVAVRPGDTLAAIAARAGIPTQDILRLNPQLRDRGVAGLRVGELVTLQPDEARVLPPRTPRPSPSRV
jgi:hypothetical protein